MRIYIDFNLSDTCAVTQSVIPASAFDKRIDWQYLSCQTGRRLNPQLQATLRLRRPHFFHHQEF